MTSNLENFCPRLRPGRVIPQGSRIIFETDNPYNQIILPMVLADMVLLCSGQFSVREIVDKIYKKQGAVPFKSMLTAIHLLHQGGFFENGDQLILSPHLQSWMKPRQNYWSLSWRFAQRISAPGRAPHIYYPLTLLVLLAAIFGLQFFPTHPFISGNQWAGSHIPGYAFLRLLLCSSILQSLRYAFSAVQLILLTSKAYNTSLRLSPWGLHLHVGDEASDLFENRLYTSMFHITQIIFSWSVVFAASFFVGLTWLEPLILMAALMTYWELNPFVNSEGRKLVRALMIENDRDVISWHFEANTLMNSINPQAQRRNEDFVRLSVAWGAVWLSLGFLLLQRSAIVFGPGVLNALASPQSNTWPLVTLGVWLGGLYFLVHFLVESLGGSLLKPWGLKLWSRFRRLKAPTHKSWPLEDIIKNIEGLPLFSHFHEQHLEKIARGSQVLHFLEGVRIIVQGDPSRDLFVLLEGEVEVLRSSPMSSSEEWSHVMGPISVFGESSLVDESPRLANVHAKRGSTVMRVPVSLLKEVAQEAQSVRQLEVFRNAILVNQFFTSSPVFRSLSPSSIEFLCSRGTLEYFDQNRAVFKQGDKGDSLYLILRGSVAVTVHQTPVKRLHQGSFFGEIALIANIPRTATISTQEPCVFFKISADSFWEVLVQHMDLGVFIESVSETRLKEDLQIVPRSGLAS